MFLVVASSIRRFPPVPRFPSCREVAPAAEAGPLPGAAAGLGARARHPPVLASPPEEPHDGKVPNSCRATSVTLSDGACGLRAVSLGSASCRRASCARTATSTRSRVSLAASVRAASSAPVDTTQLNLLRP